jgi:formate-dependent phosphoribosylglycinamide formyltransferase (GAR transformylase)
LGRVLDRISIPRQIGFQANSFESLVTAADVTGYPCFLSSNFGGSCLVNSRSELGHSWEQLYAKGSSVTVRVQPRLKIVSLLHSVVGIGLHRQFISDPVGFWTDLPEATYQVSNDVVQLTRDLATIFLDYLDVEGLFTLTFAVLENNQVVFYDFAPHPQAEKWVRIVETDQDGMSLYSQIISRQYPKALSLTESLDSDSDSKQFITL